MRRRRVVILAGAFVVVFAAATAVLFVWPRRDRPVAADAIVILGGRGDRKGTGYRLAADGLAPVLVVSMPNVRWRLPQAPAGVEVVRFRPDPYTTQGEARELGDLARARHWHRVIVVASVAQLTRARLRVSRCFDGEVVMVAAPRQGLFVPYDIAYEWAALLKALVWQRGC